MIGWRRVACSRSRPQSWGCRLLNNQSRPRADRAVFIFMMCLFYLLLILTLYHFYYYIACHNYIINPSIYLFLFSEMIECLFLEDGAMLVEERAPKDRALEEIAFVRPAPMVLWHPHHEINSNTLKILH